MTKNHKRQNGSINIVLVSQNFHQSPKDITIWTILSFQAFFINFHQKLVFYFCFKHLLKKLSQGYYGLRHTVLLEKFDKAGKVGWRGVKLSIKLWWILQRSYNMPNLEPLGFSFLYSVSETTWESFKCFRRSVVSQCWLKNSNAFL